MTNTFKDFMEGLGTDLKNAFTNTGNSLGTDFQRAADRYEPGARNIARNVAVLGLDLAGEAAGFSFQLASDVLYNVGKAIDEKHPRVANALEKVYEAQGNAYTTGMRAYWQARHKTGLGS